MDNQQDSLENIAHAYGITDADLDERESVLAQIAQEELEEHDRQALKKFSENEDFDWGYHAQWDF